MPYKWSLKEDVGIPNVRVAALTFIPWSMIASMACYNVAYVQLNVFFTAPLLYEHLIALTMLTGVDWVLWEPPMMVSVYFTLKSDWDWFLCAHVHALVNPILLCLSFSTLKACGMHCWLSFLIKLTCMIEAQILYLLLPCCNWAMWSSKSKPPLCPTSTEICPPTP